MENENNILVNDELITRYLAGEANAGEAMALHEWLTHPVNRSYFEGIKAAWHAALPAKRPRQVNESAAWSSIKRKIGKEPLSGFRESRILYFGIAASVMIIFMAGFLFYFNSADHKPTEIVVSATDSSSHINLSDNSTVILNRNSKVSYPESFGNQTREVNLLSGEAFFFVSADQNKSFIVHTSFAHIRVVGTAFNVMAKDDRLQVGVNEGKVMLYTENDSVMLASGFTGEVIPGKRSIQVKDSANVNDWGYATNRFIFKDTPLSQVIAAIEKSYPYSVSPANGNINNCKVTATFEKVSVEKMLYLVAETLNLSVTRNGKVFILEGEGCP